MEICGEIKTVFEQSFYVVYLPLIVLVAFNVFNTIKDFIEVCVLVIPLRISNFYSANFEILFIFFLVC